MRTSNFLLTAALLCAAILPTTSHAFTVVEGEVAEILGPDDLLLDSGSSVIAVDIFGNVDSIVNGVTFFTDRVGLGAAVTGEGVVTNEGVTVTTGLVNQIDNWSTAAAGPAFTGIDAASTANLSEIMRDIRWANAGAGQVISVDIAGLSPGALYNVQLLFNEGADRDRRWDIAVENVLAVDDFGSEGGDGIWTPSSSGEQSDAADKPMAKNRPILPDLRGVEVKPPIRQVGVCRPKSQHPASLRWPELVELKLEPLSDRLRR